ncbi:hypothetical protein [Flavobacterium sp. PL02]|jgi:hypothetical protein|uniref:hypothetical protein n=1 Tax=Flavobacterium sp. PL02 TaxID=3088354 RepID=UPI002B23D63D|nr:hypothetical protein [Flavobacterium sp. PL02]MEA9412713.1 hypothetical protein [Flavobacterium sp. PL02]
MKKIILLSFIICLVSCKKETKNIKKQEPNYSINVDFPDTVYVNEYYNGKINYKNIFDTVTTKLLDINKLRYIQYAFTITKDINHDNKHLKEIAIDTIYTKSSKYIPLTVIKFNQLGVNYIDGIISDQVEIDGIMLREGKMQPSTRIITHEFRATHKVVVIEKKDKKK